MASWAVACPAPTTTPTGGALAVRHAQQLRLGAAKEAHALALDAQLGAAEAGAARIVIAAGGEEPDAGLGQTLELAGEEQLRANRENGIVEEIAGGENRVEAVRDRVIDGPLERVVRRLAQALARALAAAEACLEVQVREVQEAKAHALRSLRLHGSRRARPTRDPTRSPLASSGTSLAFGSLRASLAVPSL